MSKNSVLARQVKREKLVKQFRNKREQLKENNQFLELQKLPRDSSPVRLKNRCKITGRPRAYIRMFGISRIKFREMALAGKIPGVTKSSW